MGKIAFIFPGQGSQYPGMGKEVHDAYDIARQVFQDVDQTLGFSLSGLCFQGPEDELKLTQNTQPAILTVSAAITRVLSERGFRPDFVAGHSLGEYSALVCAGALSLTDAVRVVRSRGKYMQEAVPAGKGAMAAILGLSSSEVAEACRAAARADVVSPANYNAPDQTVIAGDAAAVERASDAARQRGAKRILPLAVSAPFHCELMLPAQKRLAQDLEKVEFRDLDIMLVSNADAAEVRTGSQARESLVRQVSAPVRWVESIQRLSAAGVERFVEVGPGKVLTGLVRKIVPEAQTLNVEGIRGIEALASVFSGAKM